MANILIVDAGQNYLFSKGDLNHYLAKVAEQTLVDMGHHVKITTIEKGYEPQQEVDKFMWADVIIYQQPAWWMGGPWTLKKYIDEVFSVGTGSLYTDDGRTRKDASKKYGSGGLSQQKRYMISATWNAPIEAFDEVGQFFDGQGIDAVYYGFHKANQFLGMQMLPTFACTDVVKQPDIEHDIARYRTHLAKVLAS